MNAQIDTLGTRLGAPVHMHQDEQGALFIWLPGDGVVVTRLEGRMSLALAQALVAGVDEAIAQRPGRARAFHDWTDATGYAMRAQLRLTGWSVEVRNQMSQVMVAATAASVVLAVRAARKATGKNLEVVQTRAPWDARVLSVLSQPPFV